MHSFHGLEHTGQLVSGSLSLGLPVETESPSGGATSLDMGGRVQISFATLLSHCGTSSRPYGVVAPFSFRLPPSSLGVLWVLCDYRGAAAEARRRRGPSVIMENEHLIILSLSQLYLRHF